MARKRETDCGNTLNPDCCGVVDIVECELPICRKLWHDGALRWDQSISGAVESSAGTTHEIIFIFLSSFCLFPQLNGIDSNVETVFYG